MVRAGGAERVADTERAMSTCRQSFAAGTDPPHFGGNPSAIDAEATRVSAGSPAALTKREAEVLEHLCRGRSYAQIASELHIAFETVHTHCRNIYRKLSVSGRRELSARAASPLRPPESDSASLPVRSPFTTHTGAIPVTRIAPS